MIIYINGVDSRYLVPSQNFSDNDQMNKIIGNKTDDESGDSLYAQNYVIEKHIHSPGKMYPTLAGPIQLQKAAGAWAAYPTPTEIIPPSTITDPFDIHFAVICGISANGCYSVKLYQGATLSETEIAEIAFLRTAAQSQEGAIPVQTVVLAANVRISAALSSGNAAQDTCNIKIHYHEY